MYINFAVEIRKRLRELKEICKRLREFEEIEISMQRCIEVTVNSNKENF